MAEQMQYSQSGKFAWKYSDYQLIFIFSYGRLIRYDTTAVVSRMSLYLRLLEWL